MDLDSETVALGLGQYLDVQLRKQESSEQGHHPTDGKGERLMTETEWDELLNLLYTQLYVHEWGGLFVDRNNPDGERWELTITFTEDRKRIHKGFGGFPPYWEELKAAFLPLIREAGIS